MVETLVEDERDGVVESEVAATVLVVDDDAAVRKVAVKALRRSGYRVVEASEGEEAIQVARDHADELDVLLTDVVMPGMNGRELSERLRTHVPGLKVVFMSAYTEDEIILQGVRVAEVNFLSKPFTLQGLTSTVEQALRQGSSPDA